MVMKELCTFLETMHTVSDNDNAEVSCPYGDEDVSNLDKWGRLEHYIKLENCEKVQRREQQFLLLGYIFNSVGEKGSAKKQYTIKGDDLVEEDEGGIEEELDEDQNEYENSDNDGDEIM